MYSSFWTVWWFAKAFKMSIHKVCREIFKNLGLYFYYVIYWFINQKKNFKNFFWKLKQGHSVIIPELHGSSYSNIIQIWGSHLNLSFFKFSILILSISLFFIFIFLFKFLSNSFHFCLWMAIFLFRFLSSYLSLFPSHTSSLSLFPPSSLPLCHFFISLFPLHGLQ